jgi:hypothetical protein
MPVLLRLVVFIVDEYLGLPDENHVCNDKRG